MTESRPRRLRLETVTLALMAAIVGYQLFVPPIVGLADNHDFGRLMATVGLEHVSSEPDERYFHWVNTKYLIVPPGEPSERFLTSELAMLAPAIGINALVSKDGLFDIRVLGLVHLAVFLAAIWLVLVASRPFARPLRLLLAALLVLTWTDVSYVAYFNSLYAETASLLFLLFVVGFTVLLFTSPVRWPQLGGFFVASLLFVGAKPQNVALAPALALFCLYACAARLKRRRFAVGLGLAGGLLALAAWYYWAVPARDVRHNLFNAVFYEILPNSPTPEADLAYFGLDPTYARYAGLTAFSPGHPLEVPEFAAAFSQVRIRSLVTFYLTHPGRLVDLLRRGLRQAPLTRPWFLGNFTRADAPEPTTSRAFAVWSGAKERYLAWDATRALAWIFGCLLAAGWLLLSGGRWGVRWLGWLLALLLLMAGVQLLTVLIMEGELDLVKHLFLFNALLDLSTTGALLWLAARAFIVAREPRRKSA